MKKYLVSVLIERVQDQIVEAESWEEAQIIAERRTLNEQKRIRKFLQKYPHLNNGMLQTIKAEEESN